MDSIITETRNKVAEILGSDTSGHGMDHIDNVYNLTQNFARQEHANVLTASLIALLHDIDDYKLADKKSAKNLTNTHRIMRELDFDTKLQNTIIQSIQEIGYSKRLKGIQPTSLESKVVSDADMCDGLGINGILRTYAYGQKHGRPFFDRNIFPIENLTADQYIHNISTSTDVCHIFEKCLKLKSLMLTSAGKAEATRRHQVIVDFLYNFFSENNVPEWTEYLNKYLEKPGQGDRTCNEVPAGDNDRMTTSSGLPTVS